MSRLEQFFRFATLTVKPITCERGQEIFHRNELLKESWDGYNELTEGVEHYCDGHCGQKCHAEELRAKLEPIWEENIR